MQKNEKKRGVALRALVQTALLIAIAMVLRSASPMIYFGGGAGMRIGVAGFFTRLPALLFGPLYGGMASGIVDLLGYVLKPEGAYLWPITITAVLGGVMVGYLWRAVRGLDYRRLKGVLIAVFCVIALVGAANHLVRAFGAPAGWAAVLEKMGKKVSFAVYGLYTAAGLGLLLVLAETALKRFFPAQHNENFLRLLVVFGIANVIVTTLNTAILMVFVPGVGKNGFLVFYAVRLAEELVMVVVSAYVVGLLMRVYERFRTNS